MTWKDTAVRNPKLSGLSQDLVPYDAALKVWTYPLWKRILCWLVWQCPVTRVPFRVVLPRAWNPYRQTVLLCRTVGRTERAPHDAEKTTFNSP